MIYFIITLLFLLLAAKFFFSGAEAGFIAMDRIKYRSDLESGNQAARSLSDLVFKPDTLIAAMLFGGNFSHMAISAIFVEISGATGILWSAGAITVIILIFGEIIPKIIFRSFANRLIIKFSRLIILSRLLFIIPVTIVLKISDFLMLPFRLFPEKKLRLSRSDFHYIFREGLKSGALRRDEKELFDTIAGLSSVTAADLMHPPDQFVFVDSDTPLVSACRLVKSKNTTFALVRSADGRCSGYCDCLDVLSRHRKKTAGDLLRPAPETAPDEHMDRIYSIFRGRETKFVLVKKNGNLC